MQSDGAQPALKLLIDGDNITSISKLFHDMHFNYSL